MAGSRDSIYIYIWLQYENNEQNKPTTLWWIKLAFDRQASQKLTQGIYESHLKNANKTIEELEIIKMDNFFLRS